MVVLKLSPHACIIHVLCVTRQPSAGWLPPPAGSPPCHSISLHAAAPASGLALDTVAAAEASGTCSVPHVARPTVPHQPTGRHHGDLRAARPAGGSRNDLHPGIVDGRSAIGAGTAAGCGRGSGPRV